GWFHSCALTSGGGVQCWGYNQVGGLGNNSTTNSLVPVAVSGLSSGMQAVAAGGNHTCGGTIEGRVNCWGSNSSRELGNNSTTNSSVPVAVSGLPSEVQAIAAGGSHTCALTSGGGVLCWGDNHTGQLGNGSITESHVPVAVSGLSSGIQALTA